MKILEIRRKLYKCRCFLHFFCISSREKKQYPRGRLTLLSKSSIMRAPSALSNLFLTLLRCSFWTIGLILKCVHHDPDRAFLRSRKSTCTRARTCQYRAIVGRCNISRCISFAIRKATRMESDIIDADYRTRAFSSLIMVRSVPSGSRPVWEFPLEFFGTTGHNARTTPFVQWTFLSRVFFCW